MTPHFILRMDALLLIEKWMLEFLFEKCMLPFSLKNGCVLFIRKLKRPFLFNNRRYLINIYLQHA